MKKYLCCICLFCFPLFCTEKETVNSLQTPQIDASFPQTSTKQFTRENKEQQTVAMQPTTAKSFDYQPKKESDFYKRKGSIRFKPPGAQGPEKNPLIASALSYVLAGLGHMYLEKPVQGGSYFSVYYVTSMYSRYDLRNNPNASFYGRPYRKEASIIGSAASYYSVYAAYRDAKMFHCANTPCDQIPKDTIDSMLYAPFSPHIIAKPEVLGGIAGSLSLAVIASYMAKYDMYLLPRLDTSGDSFLSPLSGFVVAINEESFFRGVIQPALIEWTNPTLGISLASIIFGLSHVPKASLFDKEDRQNYYLFSIPFISTIGGYLGYLTYKNASLQEAIAVHGWYDFFLFTANYFSQEYFENREACVQKPRYWSLSWDF